MAPIRISFRSIAAIALLSIASTIGLPSRLLAQDASFEVKIESVKPKREKLPSLRFLKENRDFIRARFDLLREKALDHRAEAESVDPRFLAYQRLMAEAMSAGDATATLEAERERMKLLASIRELGTLEDQLDRLERLLDGQQIRLAELQQDFTGRQQTELIVLVRGSPATAADHLTLITESGATQSVSLSEAQRAALADGGVMQVFHACVEPREQVVEVRIGGDDWSAAPAGYLTLTPERDRLTLLEIDLSSATPADGGAGARARAWLHDSAIPTVDG